jgi:phenylpyruvate tautomerase PptA (4-oxalocrotonate tautomerase family)
LQIECSTPVIEEGPCPTYKSPGWKDAQPNRSAERITNTLIEDGKAQLEHIHVTFLDLPTTNYAVYGKLVSDQKPKT